MLFKDRGAADRILFESVEDQADDIMRLAKDIFDHPETGMEEYYACAKVAGYMEKEGFSVSTSNIFDPSLPPNCVVAEWGSGKPVIGILGEYDALPGCGQEGGVPYRAPKDSLGHGCYHNLSSPAGCGAAVALKYALEKQEFSATVKFISCPAEENLCGKVIMAEKGYFDGLDVAILFHGGGKFRVGRYHHSACSTYTVAFHGQTAHAAMCPEMGRSALDACELMNIGIQFLREHIGTECSIQYSYLDGGGAPNVVPAYASTCYVIRASTRKRCDELIRRVEKVAEGAALMTETTVTMERTAHTDETLHNETLEAVLQETSERLPDLVFDDEDRMFVRELYRTLHEGKEPGDLDRIMSHRIEPEVPWIQIAGASDLGDVSHVIPTLQFNGGGDVEGCVGHDWTVTTCAGSSYGLKASVYAALIIGEFCLELVKKPLLLQRAWDEFRNDTASTEKDTGNRR